MRQPTGKKSSAWFWVSVVLLSISTLWWLLIILLLLSEDTDTDAIGTSLFLTAIPIGLGIACLMARSVPKEKSPWGWRTLVAVSVLASLTAGGRSVKKPRKEVLLG